MIKIYTQVDQETKLRYIQKWQVIQRKAIDDMDNQGRRPRNPSIFYMPEKKVPTKFYKDYRKYIVDEYNTILLGPKAFEKFPNMD
jgi:hypothetical protein